MSDTLRDTRPTRTPVDLEPKPPLRVPPREPDEVSGWLQWAVVFVTMGLVAAAVLVVLFTGDTADSTLVPMGERYTDPDFDVGVRFAGENGPTLEQIDELTTGELVPLGARYADPGFDVGTRWAGTSDLTLEELEAIWGISRDDLVVDRLRWNAIVRSSPALLDLIAADTSADRAAWEARIVALP
ncbi:MAG: hypothetical protein R3290_12290 [Acidimicrobiia bacterium]|nr:hypothetical protein [Acidimicrobiia bacterium]